MIDGTFGVLGFGNMGQALVRGILSQRVFSPDRIYAFDPDETKTAVAQKMGIHCADSYAGVLQHCDYLLLACKPQQMRDLLFGMKESCSRDHIVISIAAGISTAFIRNVLGPYVKVIRVMPNTPVMVLAGASAIALGEGCTSKEETIARTIFSAVGTCEVVPETLMDVVTALSGSGPAYFFYLVECLIEAAAGNGLPNDQAARLAAQTLLGAGRLLVESQDPPQTLRGRVTSKGGTTEAAIRVLQEADFNNIIRKAVDAAVNRSKALGQ